MSKVKGKLEGFNSFKEPQKEERVQRERVERKFKGKKTREVESGGVNTFSLGEWTYGKPSLMEET